MLFHFWNPNWTIFFNWEAETKAYLEECRHGLIKKTLKKKINEGMLAVLQHYKVKEEASMLKEKNPVQKPTGVRRQSLS